jgi:hypothetical protein
MVTIFQRNQRESPWEFIDDQLLRNESTRRREIRWTARLALAASERADPVTFATGHPVPSAGLT